MDLRAVYLILVFAAVFSAAQALIGLVRMAGVKRKVNRRLVVAERVGGISELVIELRKQRGLTATGERGARWRWLSDLIMRSGVPYDPRLWGVAVAGAAVAGAVAGLLLSHKLIGAPIGALVMGLAGPFGFLKFMAGRRAKLLGHQLPQALDIIVRSLEAGHPVPTAVALVGREMPDPIGSEFGLAGDEIAYGATLEQAVERMSERCQHPDVDLFAATVRLQERAGGNLTGLLKLNAQTVRERHKMRLKIKAASSEGRVSAIILTAAPIFAAVFIQLTSPHFYGDVIHERFIQVGLGGLVVWMIIGNMVIRKMVNMRI
ncbi:type II secretion system F family protein [Phenylobacterium sp.]|uniref:type II secretion system F family protein n=1 Tax=Phenylobacterium sp. TaxID=1871053 RepID=UPI0035B3703B